MKLEMSFSLILLFFFWAISAQAKNTRTIVLAETDVAEVNTALGFSTILQFNVHPSSAVLGDQDAFKVEYVGNSLTIKPLVAGAKTNLFVFTDYDRYNFRLKTGPASVVDYILKVTRHSTNAEPAIPADVEVAHDPTSESFEHPSSQDTMVSHSVAKTAKCGAFALRLDTVAYPREKPWLILNFSVSSHGGKEEALEPSDIQVLEKKTPLIIENLYLESLKIPGNGNAVHGTAMLKRKSPNKLSGLSLLMSVPRSSPGNCSELKITLSTAKAVKEQNVRKRVRIDSYFLSERCPFSGRRKPNWKRIKMLSGFGLLGLVVGLLFWGPAPERTVKAEGAVSEPSNQITPPNIPAGSDYLPRAILPESSTRSPGGSRALRQYSASQLVRRGEGSGDRLPVGSTIPGRLVNSVLSTDSNSPVIVEIPDDVIWKSSVIIPSGTRAIGQATLDDASQRLQARFQTLVFPEGDQHSISAIALMGDGSSGIAGDYHSREIEKQGGRFIGNFVGGLAEGMKQRESSGGQYGIVFEPGSLKNGLLNGLSASSFDQAKVLSDSAQNLRPYLEVKAGALFVLYLEKEFGP